MKLLRDIDLELKVQSDFVSGYDYPKDLGSRESPIQPASLDLHIGNIYVPDSSQGEPGSSKKPLYQHLLGAGETVYVETAETFKVPKNLAGFGFPPAAVAVKGILMTNPGHIDPGFEGRLSFTLINMGKKPFTIERGHIVFTTLWVELEGDAENAASDRKTKNHVSMPLEERVAALSKDFMNVDERADKISKKNTVKTPVISGLLALVVAIIIPRIDATHTKIEALDIKLECLATTVAERTLSTNPAITNALSTLSKKADQLSNKDDELSSKDDELEKEIESLKKGP